MIDMEEERREKTNVVKCSHFKESEWRISEILCTILQLFLKFEITFLMRRLFMSPITLHFNGMIPTLNSECLEDRDKV